MKKFLLVAGLILSASTLSACAVVPYNPHYGYHGPRRQCHTYISHYDWYGHPVRRTQCHYY